MKKVNGKKYKIKTTCCIIDLAIYSNWERKSKITNLLLNNIDFMKRIKNGISGP